MDFLAERKINEDLLRPLRRTSLGFFILIAFLGGIILVVTGNKKTA